jgi:hypothetical protein
MWIEVVLLVWEGAVFGALPYCRAQLLVHAGS